MRATCRGLAAVTLMMPIACTVPMSAAQSLRANGAYFYPDRKRLTALVGGRHEFLDGGSTCAVTLPGPIPARDFWSFTVNVLLRLYGPLEPWFDKTWKPGDFEWQK